VNTTFGGLFATLTAIVVTVTAPVQAVRADEVDPAAEELAERYAPIVMVRTQPDDCDPDGEPFAPMSVDLLLGNPQIALRQVGNGDPTAMRGPTAADLHQLGEGFYLDLPGDSLRPGCVYEQDHDRLNAGNQPVVYAHIARQPDRPDRLAVQYWLYWYYNDWNNVHESDWEFVQVVFPAGSVEEALRIDPIEVGYAQHEGGERASWTADKLRREGDHPVVYSSQRSHAGYFEPSLFMGRSADEGFGCDNTASPSTRLEPAVVTTPEEIDGPDDPFAWLAFEGRWGERHASPNNGPTGPNTKDQWTAPITWQDGLRDDSFAVPAGDAAGTSVVHAFCEVVAWGSVKFVQFVASPVRVLAAIAIVALGVGWLAHRTTWDAVPPAPVVRRRRAGEIVRAGLTLYRTNPRTLAITGLIAVPVLLAAVAVSAAVARLPFIGDLFEVADSEGMGARVATSAVLAGVAGTLAFTLVSAAVSATLHRAGDTLPTRRTAREALGEVRGRTGALASAFTIAAVVIVLLQLVVVGAPIALWLLVRWQFLGPAVMIDGLAGRTALHRSSRLVAHRWWHTALLTVGTMLAVNGLGLVIGLLLLVIFTGLPLWVLAAIAATVGILAAPLGATIITLLYGDAVAERERPVATTSDAPSFVGSAGE
jgi:hypothetical protein